MSKHDTNQPGIVYIVGAGPGDAGLITLRGVECLGRADLVIYDCLVNPAILEHAPPSAERLCLGSPDTLGRLVPQQEVNARMIHQARQAKTIVRLKGGDCSVFSRNAEETEVLRAAGIPFEVVPGVTAAVAAAGYAEIPITHSAHSSAVALVTGHLPRDSSAAELDYGALADFPGTLVFYMGLDSARHWSRSLLSRGKPLDTPVAIVRRATWADQSTVNCTLGSVAAVVDEKELKPPAVIFVGEAVSMVPEISWFSARPLFGVRVMVTRPRHQAESPRHQAESLCRRLGELGADVLLQPAIQISEPPDWKPVDEALSQLDRYDWLVFSSANGVCFLLDRLRDIGGDLRSLGKIRVAAIGPGTAEQLAEYHLRADLVPVEYRAESLAAALAGEAVGRRFLLARASRGREVLAEELTAAGGKVDQIVVYSSSDVERADPRISAELTDGRIDWITVTSSAIARSLNRLFGDAMHEAKLASISPVTSEVLHRLGFEPAVEASCYTTGGLVEAIVDFSR